MTLHTSLRRSAISLLPTLTLALAVTLSLSSCAGATVTAPASASAAATATATASESKEAALFSKDVNLCFQNRSAAAVVLDWRAGVNTTTGVGSLAVGQTLCGEGGWPKAALTFSNGFTTIVLAENPDIGFPTVAFKNSAEITNRCYDPACGLELDSETYANAAYSQNETIGSDVEGHHFATTRNPNDNWVQFTVVIND